MNVKFSELPVFNQDHAEVFYAENLGWHVAADQPMGPDEWCWTELQFPDAETTRTSFRATITHYRRTLLVLVHDPVEEVAARLQSKQVEIITSSRPAPWQPNVTIAKEIAWLSAADDICRRSAHEKLV